MATVPPNPISTSTMETQALLPLLDPVIPLNLPISTKLNQNNFLTWKSQILPILHGYNLSRFIDGTPPPATVPDATGLQVNPEFLQWHRQDQLLLGWIRSSLTEAIQAQVAFCATTAEVWNHLLSSFSSASRARLTDLRRQLQTTFKGSASCTDYLNKIRQISDELAFIGAPVSSDDLLMAVLNGLGPDFNLFTVAISTLCRKERLTFAELQGMLLSHEALLSSQASFSSFPNWTLPVVLPLTDLPLLPLFHLMLLPPLLLLFLLLLRLSMTLLCLPIQW